METRSIWWYIIEVVSVITVLYLRDLYIRTKRRKEENQKILGKYWDVNNPIQYRWNIVKLKNLRTNNVFLPVNKWTFEPSNYEIAKKLIKGLK